MVDKNRREALATLKKPVKILEEVLNSLKAEELVFGFTDKEQSKEDYKGGLEKLAEYLAGHQLKRVHGDSSEEET